MPARNAFKHIDSELLEYTQDLFYVLSTAGEILYVNRALNEFLQTTSSEPDLPSLVASVEHSNSVAELPLKEMNSHSRRRIDSVLPASVNTHYIILNDKHGLPRYLECGIFAVTLADGTCADARVLRDVTAQYQLELHIDQVDTALAEASRVTDALNEVTVELINHLDLKSLLHLVAERAAQISGADYTYVSMVHHSNDYLETVAVGQHPQTLRNVKHRPGEGMAGECWQHAATVCTDDYQNYQNRLPGLTAFNQVCAIPIMVENKVIGVLGGAFNSQEINIKYQAAILEKFARLVAVAIENTKLHQKNKAELANTESISKLSQAIYGSENLQSLLNSVCITMVRDFKASKAQIYQYASPSTFSPVIAWEQNNNGLESVPQISSAMIAESVGLWSIKHKETAFLPRGTNDSRESARVHELRQSLAIGSTVCVPLVHNHQAWGVLFIHRRLSQLDFSKSDINLFKIIGNQTSVALHRHDLLERIQHQAYHDNLTDLPNRFAFESQLQQRIEVQPDRCLAILFIDLDGFKGVNDRLGHRAGDRLLQSVARRFNKCLRSQDTLARLGGDEFAAMLEYEPADGEALACAYRLIHCIGGSIMLDGASVEIGASIGISYYPEHAIGPAELLRNADIAMYTAKSAGKGTASEFDPEMARSHERRLAMEQDLKKALEDEQFELHYQPKVRCDTATVSGVEALIRWNHPEKGFVSPVEFIPMAEECGLIQRIGSWVINEACRQARLFVDADLRISMAINISAQQFLSTEFNEQLRQVLDEHQLPPEMLELEVTETVMMNDIPVVVKRLSELRRWGISIAIDDFGTGYSSLQYLEDLPLDVLKIDKAFVDKLAGGSSDKSLVKTIILMAKSFGLDTVAEGVETAEQLRHIEALGCDFVQGYYYSKPLSASELPAKMNEINSKAAQIKAA